MTYVTNAERFGFQRGIQEGRQEGELAVIFRQLARRIGTIAPPLETKIRTLSLTQLEDLSEALLDFTYPSDLEQWLQSHQ